QPTPNSGLLCICPRGLTSGRIHNVDGPSSTLSLPAPAYYATFKSVSRFNFRFNHMNKIHRTFLLSPPIEPSRPSLLFLRQARFALSEEFLIKIAGTIEPLSDDQLWWRPNQESNSIGNLLLHLAGNARQWMIAGVGGAEDLRDRDREFSERTRIPKAELLALVTSTLVEVDAVLVNLETELVRDQS